MKAKINSLAWKRALNICSWILIGLLLVLILLLFMSAFKLGIQAFVVSSGSMSPAIRSGELVFVRSSDSYEVGEVITFIDPSNKYITHRVYEIESDDGEVAYITKGDANDAPDVSPVQQSNVRGKVTFHIPLIGYAIAFLRTRVGLILLVAVLAGILIFAIFSSRPRGKGGDIET
jgi:signal peptidase